MKRLFRNIFLALLALLTFTQAHIAINAPGADRQLEFSLVQEADANACTATNPSGNWGTAGTWTNCGGVAPTSTDSCAISGTGTITVEAATGTSTDICGDIDFTGFTGTLTFAASKQLNVAGNITFVSGMTYAANSSSLLKFIATATGKTITTGGKQMPPMTFDGVGGGWTLQDNLASNGGIGVSVTLTNGALDTNSKTVTNFWFSSSNSNTRSLTLGTTNWTPINGTGTYWDIGTSTGMTLSAASSTITIPTTSTTAVFNGGGLTYGTVTATAMTTGTVTINQANTFGTLTASQGNSIGLQAGYGFYFGADQTVTGTCTFNGNSTLKRDVIQSSVKGTQRQISCGTVSTTQANFMDIKGAGAGSWNLSALDAGDLGGNSSITFPTPKTCYLKNGGVNVNISSATIWETTDGGSTLCTPVTPLPQDTGMITSTGWTGSSKVLTIDNAMMWMPKLDFSAAPAMTLTFSNGADYPYDLVFGSNLTLSGSSQIAFLGSGTRTAKFTTAGKTLPQIVYNYGGPNFTVQQQDNLTTSSATANPIQLNSGIWDQNVHTITCTADTTACIGFQGGNLIGSANITGNTFVYTYSAGSASNLSFKAGYALSNLSATVATIGASSGGGSSSCGADLDLDKLAPINDNVRGSRHEKLASNDNLIDVLERCTRASR